MITTKWGRPNPLGLDVISGQNKKAKKPGLTIISTATPPVTVVAMAIHSIGDANFSPNASSVNHFVTTLSFGISAVVCVSKCHGAPSSKNESNYCHISIGG